MGIFNRSYFEEVLIVRVQPELLGPKLARKANDSFWKRRYRDINNFERYLVDNRIHLLKFYLHLSKEEQARRLLARLERPEKHWKFSPSDLREHGYWDDYQRVYEAALRATSTADEPWYVIPADHKWLMRTAVAAIVVEHLADIDPRYPMPSQEQIDEMRAAIAQFESGANGAGADPTRHGQVETPPA
jgi:polyphosphate kinase 2 (PPK2 family)